MKYPNTLLKPIKKFLVSRERELKLRSQKLGREDPFADEDRINSHAAVDEGAMDRFDHDRVLAMRRELDKGLVRVRKALTRINLGTYGTCEECGKMIDTDRLAIDPASEFCIECESKREKS